MTTVEKLRELMTTYQEYKAINEELDAMRHHPNNERVTEMLGEAEVRARRMLDLGAEIFGGVFDDVHRIADAAEALTRKGNHP